MCGRDAECLGSCSISMWIDVKREVKVGVWNVGDNLNVKGVEQPSVVGLYVDDTVLLAESERMLQKIVHEFDRICKRRKLKVNAGKSKVIVLGKAKRADY